MSAWDISICQTCLSDNRVLYPMCRLKIVLRELGFLQPQEEGGICWECQCIIKKLHKFKIQALHAQNILRNNLKLKYLGNLSRNTKSHFYYEISHNEDPESSHNKDPLINEECPIKIELTIKEEEPYIGDVGNEDSFPQESLSNSLEDVKPDIDRLDEKFDVRESTDIDNNDIDKQDCFLQENLSYNSEDVKAGIVRIDERVEVNKLIDKDNYEKTKDSKVKILKNVKKKAVEHDTQNGKMARKDKQEPAPTKTQDQEPDILEPVTKETKAKVTVVRLTEEEMLGKREKKWHHNSFKGLPHKCETCVLGFKTREKYDAHVDKVHHEKNGPHACPVCAARYPNVFRLETHVEKHYSMYRCTACEFRASLHHAVVLHYKEKHPDRPGHASVNGEYAGGATCDQCGEWFRNRRQMRAHIIKDHEPLSEYVCDVCRRTFRMKATLEAHLATHSAARHQLYCGQCDVTYKHAHTYRTHLRTSAKHARRRFKCKVCSKLFLSKANVNRHYAFYHLKKSRYKCVDCDKLFESNCKLLFHQQVHHGSERPRKYACELCDKRFYTQTMLRSHRLIHSSQRSFMCEECGDTFKQRAALYTHTILVHKKAKVTRKIKK